MNGKMIHLSNISKSFGKDVVLRDVSLHIETGKTHVLLGPSGSGKTTLLRIILGLESTDSGELQMDAQPTTSSIFGYVPQDAGLYPHLSAYDNVTLVPKLQKWTKERMTLRCEELASLANIDASLLKKFPSQLSGGQRQRIALMRALFMDPSILVLDEPLGALDPLTRFELQNQLKSIFQKLSKTVIIVTHDLAEAAFFADSVSVFYQGVVAQTGRFEELVNAPKDDFVKLYVSSQLRH
jgi:osmoprotectant transport system ATP-binding protein